MNTLMRVRGVELRYLLTWSLSADGPETVADLVDRLAYYGFGVAGRPSKTVSDALRWELRRGRVLQCGHGRYMPGLVPRSTEYRIDMRVRELRVKAGTLSPERAAWLPTAQV